MGKEGDPKPFLVVVVVVLVVVVMEKGVVDQQESGQEAGRRQRGAKQVCPLHNVTPSGLAGTG